MFQKQPPMRRVLYSLIPIYLFSAYLYGWRVLVLTVINFGLGILTEYILEKTRKKKVSEAVLVTCALYTLSLPPAVPFWVSAVGIIFAVFMGKGVYGGFGRNVFNPAITGRLFIYITFPAVLTGAWLAPGAFGMGLDGVSSATPLSAMRLGEVQDLFNLLIGFRAGSIGESSIILIIAAGIYLIATKTASWRVMLSTLGSAAILTFCLDIAGVQNALPTLPALLSGSLMFITVFMVTDPVSGPNNKKAHWWYGLIIGSVTILIRTFSGFSEGTSFGIMIGNTFASLLDEAFVKKKKVEKKTTNPTGAKA